MNFGNLYDFLVKWYLIYLLYNPCDMCGAVKKQQHDQAGLIG